MISKADCVSVLDKKDMTDYTSFCDVIDERLKKYHRAPITISTPTGISDKVVARIISEYSDPKAGWKVERGDDQREPGAWLTFS